MKKLAHLLTLGSALALAGGVSMLAPATAQGMPVFDATNYAQNLLQAARALDQINNQIKSLQNEATMLENMACNLKQIDFPQLTKISANLQAIDQLMAKAKGVEFQVDKVEDQFRSLFPGASAGALTSEQGVRNARARLDNAFENLRHNMAVQAEVVSSIRSDGGLLNELAEKSQGSVGSLQAQQATNQLLALSTKQQLQLQELLAAEFRSEALERARQAQEQSDAEAQTRRFLGSGTAYTPLSQ